MQRSRRHHASTCTARVALEVLRGDAPLAARAARHGVHAPQIAAWRTPAAADAARRIRDLHATVGERTMARDCLSGALGRCGLPSATRGSPGERCDAPTPVRPARSVPIEPVRPAHADLGGRCCAHAPHGRAAPAASVPRSATASWSAAVLWVPASHAPASRTRAIERPNPVWAADITDLPLATGGADVVAIRARSSRTGLRLRGSNAMRTDCCMTALEAALTRGGAPGSFTTAPGSPVCTALDGTTSLRAKGVRRAGTGRWVDTVFVERRWRRVQDEALSRHAYETVGAVNAARARSCSCSNARRPHQSLAYRTPDELCSAEPATCKQWRRLTHGFPPPRVSRP